MLCILNRSGLGLTRRHDVRVFRVVEELRLRKQSSSGFHSVGPLAGVLVAQAQGLVQAGPPAQKLAVDKRQAALHAQNAPAQENPTLGVVACPHKGPAAVVEEHCPRVEHVVQLLVVSEHRVECLLHFLHGSQTNQDGPLVSEQRINSSRHLELAHTGQKHCAGLGSNELWPSGIQTGRLVPGARGRGGGGWAGRGVASGRAQRSAGTQLVLLLHFSEAGQQRGTARAQSDVIQLLCNELMCHLNHEIVEGQQVLLGDVPKKQQLIFKERPNFFAFARHPLHPLQCGLGSAVEPGFAARLQRASA
eukprot:RCo020248